MPPLDDYRERLMGNLKVLNETIWERRMPEPRIEAWLKNFATSVPADSEKNSLHALHLLSQFMYFGSRELKALLLALYRDLYRYPLIQEIRQREKNTLDSALVSRAFKDELKATRFLGVGNPSESGVHLLYYFRQENNLPKDAFIHTHEIFSRRGPAQNPGCFSIPGLKTDRRPELTIRDPSIRHYVFLDDLCGSGTQAIDYSREILQTLSDMGSKAKVYYYVLFATSAGIKRVRENSSYDRTACVFELDETYRCLDSSRYFDPPVPGIDRAYARDLCERYGARLLPEDPLGYKNGQLLVGFHHNTPDNTLPVIWSDDVPYGSQARWEPAFRRYWKKYTWENL